MNAIPKALAIANPKHVVACVATVAGAITSKFAIDAVYDEIDDELDEAKILEGLEEGTESVDPEISDIERTRKLAKFFPLTEAEKCERAFMVC